MTSSDQKETVTITRILVGNCLEIGVFQSVRARTGPRGPKAKRQNHHGQRDLFTTKRLRAPIMTDERAADLATRRAMGLMKRSISTAIGLTQKQMPVQCLQQREA